MAEKQERVDGYTIRKNISETLTRYERNRKQYLEWWDKQELPRDEGGLTKREKQELKRLRKKQRDKDCLGTYSEIMIKGKPLLCKNLLLAKLLAQMKGEGWKPTKVERILKDSVFMVKREE